MKNQISIAIAGHNCSDTIQGSLESCLNAKNNLDYEMDVEIVYVDDASTDNSLAIVQEYAKNNKDLDIRIVRHKTNQSCARTRKTGARYAKYDYIYFMDADDYVMENFFNVIAQKPQTYKLFILQWTSLDDPKAHLKDDPKLYEQDILPREVMLFANASITNKVWKRELFDDNNYSFRKNGGEDWSYSKILFPKYFDSIEVSDVVTNIYNSGNESMTRSKEKFVSSVFHPLELKGQKGTFGVFQIFAKAYETYKESPIELQFCFDYIMLSLSIHTPTFNPRKLEKYFKLWQIPDGYVDFRRFNKLGLTVFKQYRKQAKEFEALHWQEHLEKI